MGGNPDHPTSEAKHTLPAKRTPKSPSFARIASPPTTLFCLAQQQQQHASKASQENQCSLQPEQDVLEGQGNESKLIGRPPELMTQKRRQPKAKRHDARR